MDDTVGATPKRIQLRRTKGWRKPEGAIVVSRHRSSGSFGNPYVVGRDGSPSEVVEKFRDFVMRDDIGRSVAYWSLEMIRHNLAGHDLACWCPLEDSVGNRVPCHADVLLELANPGWKP